MNDDRRGLLDDLLHSYGAVRLWIVGLLGPGLVVSELLQGRLSLGVGLGFVCIMIWIKLAGQLGFSGRGWERVSNVCLTVGGLLLAWHYLRWWIEFLRGR